ncbi:MAG: hypothetical protein A2Y91_01370 [Chloroflexi bacterium RBG_13_54_8]|nr:MAG: hypothetical protein A2Y91_01370 [Chloroflexi bacterium RBG_13_54_8]
MAEEKHPSQSSELAAQQLNLAQRLLWRIIARMVRVIDEKYGEEGLRVIYEGLRDWDYWKVPIRKAGLVPGEASLEDTIHKVLEPGDKLLFSMQEHPLIEKLSEDKWLYKVRHCNVADVITRESWKTCPVVSRGIEEGVAKAANPNIKLTGDKYLVTGEDGCYSYYEMTESPKP